MKLQDRLRELRGSVTQTQFARDIEVNPGNYSKWERGETIPDYKTLIKIADYNKEKNKGGYTYGQQKQRQESKSIYRSTDSPGIARKQK